MKAVYKRRDEGFERFMKRFLRIFNSTDIRHEMRKHEYYTKPSEVKNKHNQDIKFRERKKRKQEKAWKLKNKTKKRRW